MLTRYLNENTVAARCRAADKAEAIRIAGDLLVKLDLVDPRYIDEMISSVNHLGPYIVISPGIAFAHARPSELVREDCVSLVTLDPPVSFDHPKNDPVSVLFVLAARHANQHLSVMRAIAKLITRPNFVADMTAAECADDLLRYLNQAEPTG